MASFSDDFELAQNTVIDVNGNAALTISAGVTWHQWVIEDVVVRTSQPAGTVPIPTADVWKNDPSFPSNHRGGTRNGDHDTARGRIKLQGTDVLVVTFTGGRPGDTAYAIATGTYTAERAFPAQE